MRTRTYTNTLLIVNVIVWKNSDDHQIWKVLRGGLFWLSRRETMWWYRCLLHGSWRLRWQIRYIRLSSFFLLIMLICLFFYRQVLAISCYVSFWYCRKLLILCSFFMNFIIYFHLCGCAFSNCYRRNWEMKDTLASLLHMLKGTCQMIKHDFYRSDSCEMS